MRSSTSHIAATFRFLFIASLLACSTNTQLLAESSNPFVGTWAMTMPHGNSGSLTIKENAGEMDGELWTHGQPRALSELKRNGSQLEFMRTCKVGAPEYVGGPPTGDNRPYQHTATIEGDTIRIVINIPVTDSAAQSITFAGKRMPPLPPRPDLSKIRFGDPIELFNGRDLTGWKLSNPEQINGWKAVDGILVNETPKLSFSPWSKYGNLQTEREFMDFRLSIEFKVPPGGNSGVYLRGVYEAQVVDRDSPMQGIQGVGAIFGRIVPSENVGKPGDEWQHYVLTLVDRHITVELNGVTVIDNQPLPGCTVGALQADETIPGPLYLQGDHTSVSYRNILLQPVLHNENPH